MSVINTDSNYLEWEDRDTGDKWRASEAKLWGGDGEMRFYKNGKRIKESRWCLETQGLTKSELGVWRDAKGRASRLDGPACVSQGGISYWYFKNKLHRAHGRPAIEYEGFQCWKVNGLEHRVGGPSYVRTLTNERRYEQHGVMHNFFGPCIGDRIWAINGIVMSAVQHAKYLEQAGFYPVLVGGGSDAREVCYKKGTDNEIHRDDGFPAVVHQDGAREWYFHGKRHRMDGPAHIDSEGNKFYYQNGDLHREDGPAVEYMNGSQEWYVNGQIHRKGGPALITINDSDGEEVREWSHYDQSHRLDGPYLEIFDNEGQLIERDYAVFGKSISEEEFLTGSVRTMGEYGESTWIKVGEGVDKVLPHRLDGPAIIEADGTQRWYRNGLLHREDGPAVIWTSGKTEYYVNGEHRPELVEDDKETLPSVDAPRHDYGKKASVLSEVLDDTSDQLDRPIDEVGFGMIAGAAAAVSFISALTKNRKKSNNTQQKQEAIATIEKTTVRR